jgi:hypothetical protein
VKLIAEGLALYFDTIYKPKNGNRVYLNLHRETIESEVLFFVLKELSQHEKEIVYHSEAVKLIWIALDNEKHEIVMPAFELANAVGAVVPTTVKKEITMCLLRGLV